MDNLTVCGECGKSKPASAFSRGYTLNGKPGCNDCGAAAFHKNYDVECFCCGEKPTVGETELCGPCCFGEADTAGGNW